MRSRTRFKLLDLGREGIFYRNVSYFEMPEECRAYGDWQRVYKQGCDSRYGTIMVSHEFFAFAAERGEVFERITCAGPHGALQAQMESRVLERHGGSGADDPERSLLMAFVTASTLAIYREWVADGKRVPPDQVADLAAKLVCRGAEGLSA